MDDKIKKRLTSFYEGVLELPENDTFLLRGFVKEKNKKVFDFIADLKKFIASKPESEESKIGVQIYILAQELYRSQGAENEYIRILKESISSAMAEGI